MLEDSGTIALEGSEQLVGAPAVQREVWRAMVGWVEVGAGQQAWRTFHA